MAVLADENASQADVDAAVAALKAAYAGLVKADDGNGGNNNQEIITRAIIIRVIM